MSIEPLVIRAAEAAHLPRVTEIYRHYVLTHTATFEIEPPSLAEMTGRYRKIVGDGFPYLVAERGGQVVGYAYAALYRTRVAYRFTVEDSIYVDPAAAGEGVGAPLLGALVEACARLGSRQMVAVIGDSANVASIRLHERCGFVRVGLLPDVGFKFGRWLDSVLMQRALGSGSGSDPIDR